METILILFVLVAGFIFLAYLLSKKNNTPKELIDVIRIMQQGSDNTSRIMGDVQKNLGEIGEIGRSMKDLQEFLKSPKIRGNVGEHILKELLAQMLPKDAFYLQYAFKSGEKVDAAVKTSAGIIPIDSKFPMENFRKMLSAKSDLEKNAFEKQFVRDIKIHVDSISRKYILSEEGTIDYALMYIPSEAVYYEVVNNPDLFEYAGKKAVLPVSPTTFYAYIKAILMSFEGQKIESKAREILVNLKAIQKEYEKTEENLGILQRHMTNAFNMMNTTLSSFGQLGQKINKTKSIDDKSQPVDRLEKDALSGRLD